MLKRFLIVIALVWAGGLTTGVRADDPIYTGNFNDYAVSGYDTVAYFTHGKPMKGKKEFTYEYMNAEWRFMNQENMDLFKANPVKYMPQYGGYCAWAMARGHTASAEPDQWQIVDGKLYLNYSAKVKAKWEKDIPGFIKKADKKYPETVDFDND